MIKQCIIKVSPVYGITQKYLVNFPIGRNNLPIRQINNLFLATRLGFAQKYQIFSDLLYYNMHVSPITLLLKTELKSVEYFKRFKRTSFYTLQRFAISTLSDLKYLMCNLFLLLKSFHKLKKKSRCLVDRALLDIFFVFWYIF